MGELAARVQLRPIEPDRDAADVADLHRRTREFMREFDPERPAEYFTEAGVRAMLHAARATEPDQRAEWLIELDGVPVGKITLSNIVRRAFQNAAVGYFVEQDLNGRGIATRALELVVAEAFGPLGLHRIEAAVLPDNARSIRVLEKAGFVRIGLSPKHLCIGGAWCDMLVFAITAELWEEPDGTS